MAIQVALTRADIDGLLKMEGAVSRLGDNLLSVIAPKALNRAGDMARTQVIKALAKQTGLKQKIIRRAVRTKRAATRGGEVAYRLSSRGGDIGLGHFKVRETRRGLNAKPFGKPQIFPGVFTHGGRFPKRVRIGLGGHAFKRSGADRLPIEKVKSGVIIPEQMVQGATAAAFKQTIGTVLPRRLLHEAKRETGGVFG